jgi:hypothetical protein
MNTRKQVLIMSALLLVMLIAIGIYAAWYPGRATDAEAHFQEQTSERGSILFARNCRLCHGDVGEGGALGARLPAAPALSRPDLQGFADSKATLAAAVDTSTNEIRVSDGSKFKGGQTILIDEERMDIKSIDNNTLKVERAVPHTSPARHAANAQIQLLDPAALKDKMKLITNTITCGRVGTAMPAWAQSQGGPLSDEQLRQLMTVITTARWDLVKEEVDTEDKKSARLLAPVSDDATTIEVSDVSAFTEKEAIRIGDERLRLTSVPKTKTVNGRSVEIKDAKDKSGSLGVQRGVLGTTPFEHTPDEPIYTFPETSEPSINMASCGQTAKATVPSNPQTIECADCQNVEMVVQNIAFSTQQISVKANAKVHVRLDNRDPGTDHNIAFYKSSTDTTPVSTGSVGITFKGLAVNDTVFDAPAAGSYFFRCDTHPTIPAMTGTFTVTP